jgi:hypothetical protein
MLEKFQDVGFPFKTTAAALHVNTDPLFGSVHFVPFLECP